MKKVIYSIAIAAFIASTTLVSCKPSSEEEVVLDENVQQAKENVQDAKDTLSEARKASRQAEWEAFKNDADSIVNVNDAKIAQLKLDMKKSGKTIDAKYQENIDALEEKNKNLKVKVKTFKTEANADWQSFKKEFNHDMTELGQAFKNLTVKNN